MNAIYQHVWTHLHSDIHMKGLAIAVQSAASARINMQRAVFFILKPGSIISKKSLSDHLSSCGPAVRS